MVSDNAPRTGLVSVLLLCLVGLAAMPCMAAEDVAGTTTTGGFALHDDTDLVIHVMQLARERLRLMPAVAAAKWPTRMPISDPAREAVVARTASERAATLGLSPAPVEQFFSLQMALARRVQEDLTAHWQATGFDYAGPPLTLADDLRPRLDRLTGELLTALYLAAPALRRPDFAGWAMPLAAQVFDEDHWSPTDRDAWVSALAAITLTSPSTLARARASGVLRIGTPADYAPFSVAVDQMVSGSDVTLAARLAEGLGLVPIFLQTSWRTLLQDLGQDHFDIVVGGVSATPARLAVAAAGPAVSRSGKTAVGRCTDTGRLGTEALIDQPSVRVIENAGGTNETFARSRLKNATLVIHPDNRTVFDEILANRADAMYTDEVEVALVTHRHPELCRLLTQTFDPVDKTFLYPRNGHWEEAIDPWIAAAVRDGLPARLLEAALAY